MIPDVFISYSREDQQKVVKLVEYLRERGLSVWMDETDIHGATMWTEEIVEAIHKCTLFILAISNHSTGSKNVVKELALASEREKKILPLYFEQCEIPKNMEYQLAGIQNIALYSLDKSKAYEFVYQNICRLGVANVEEKNKALIEKGTTTKTSSNMGGGHIHMLPPKSKSSISKWISITTAAVIVCVITFFITNARDEVKTILDKNTKLESTKDSSIRIALLPFEVNAAKEEDKWFGGGMDNELKNALNNINDITIIAGLSVNTFRGVNRDISKIKSNLDVQYIIDGSITVNAEKVSINLDFINANDLSVVWSYSTQAKPESVFDNKGDIASKVAKSLNIQIGSKTTDTINSKHTENVDAFKLYTQGRALWMTRSQAGMKQSIKLYRQATELDDKFALAYTGIADAYSMLAVYGFMNPNEAYPQARKYVLDAITRNASLPEAYISLGWIQFAYEWKLKESEASYRKAIKLNPKKAQAHQWLGINLESQGKLKEAYNSLTQGLNLDPNHHVLLRNLNSVCNSLGKFEEAEKLVRKSLSVNPMFFSSWIGLYHTYLLSSNKNNEINNLIQEIEVIVNKTEPIYNILIHHYHKEKDQNKVNLYYKQADELDKLSGNRYLNERKIVKLKFDKFMSLAEEAYRNNTIDFGFEYSIFMIDHLDNPKFKAFVNKKQKGK